MIRLLFTIIAGVLLGGVVHLVSVLALPRIATQDAYSRLTPMTKRTPSRHSVAEPNNAPMPFMDPAFAVAICRYDLSGGPISSTVPVSQAYTSCRSTRATRPITPSTTARPPQGDRARPDDEEQHRRSRG